jgi:hypothetical protein
MMRSTFTIISAGCPCVRSPAVPVCLRGFRGVVPVLRVVTAFELIRRCISRDGTIDLAKDLRPQLLGHAGVDRVDDATHLHPEVGDAGTAGPGFNERLQPSGGDHAGVHINLGARIDKGLPLPLSLRGWRVSRGPNVLGLDLVRR